MLLRARPTLDPITLTQAAERDRIPLRRGHIPDEVERRTGHGKLSRVCSDNRFDRGRGPP